MDLSSLNALELKTAILRARKHLRLNARLFSAAITAGSWDDAAKQAENATTHARFLAACHRQGVRVEPCR